MEREFQVSLGYVWLGTLPEYMKYAGGKVLERAIDATNSSTSKARYVALRQFIAGWGQGSGGALGATYIPNASHQLVVQVVLAKDVDTWSLTAGLSEEFAPSILDEAARTLQATTVLGSGVLRFDHALQHPVDSNIAIFRVLTRAVILLLDKNPDTLTEEEANRITQQCRQEYSARSKKLAESSTTR